MYKSYRHEKLLLCGRSNSLSSKLECVQKHIESKSTVSILRKMQKTPNSVIDCHGNMVDSAFSDVEKTVADCWNVIEEQCENSSLPAETKSNEQLGGEWKIIRLFVSSTFTDFHSEREILVKKVFPALREWCQERHIHLVECDLRWGVPKDTTSVGTICACMEEIDRSLEENQGTPFFLNMLGERYGWCPGISEIPSDIAEKYQWIHGVSITHMEILHGAYRRKNPNAIFFLRDNSIIKNLPESQLSRFADADVLSKKQLQVLKEKLSQRFPLQTLTYTCGVGETTDDGKGKLTLNGLEDFADRTLNFFKEAIDRQYPMTENNKIMTDDEQDEEMNRKMYEMKSMNFCGREQELSVLMDFVNGIIPDDMAIMRESDAMKTYDCNEDNKRMLCVSGKSGIGKSVLLAAFVKQLVQSNHDVFYHNVGCNLNSIQSKNIIWRILSHVASDLEDVEKLRNGLETDIQKELCKCMKGFDENRRQLVIVIDGLNEMSDSESVNRLNWLPARWPKQIACIVSTDSDHTYTMGRVQACEPYVFELGEIDKGTRISIVHNFFLQYNKRLDDNQMAALVSSSGAATPLWLSISCEEVRIHGDFRTLGRKICGLPDNLEQLLIEVLDRMIKEDETDCMEKTLRLIYCSLGGLPEAEARGLLGNLDTKEELPMLSWSSIRRALKPFIRTVSFWTTGTHRIQFFHSAMKQAVKSKLMTSAQDETGAHQTLADYYDYHCKDDAYTVEDLPHHLLNADLKKRLRDFFRTDWRSMKSSNYARQNYMNKIRCTVWTPPNMPGHNKPFKICSQCAWKGKILNPTSMKTSQHCVVCGSWAPMKTQMSKDAFFCSRHAHPGPPNCDYCGICDKWITGPFAPGVQGYLCNMCSCSPQSSNCCQLLV